MATVKCVTHVQHCLKCFRTYILLQQRHVSYIAPAEYNKLQECYSLLNVGSSCSNDELRDAYLSLVKKYHPDSVYGQANAAKFAQVEAAYRHIATHRKKTEVTVSTEDKVVELKQFDIEHTAPQHRQYLEYEGAGYGTPSQRQRQFEQRKVAKAVENIFEYQVQKITSVDENSMVTKDKKETRKRTIRSAIDRLAEDLIAESMAKGDFDNLPGSGKPLKYSDHNPYVDSMTHNLNKVLINNGYAPPWITLEKEIRSDTQKAREQLRTARAAAGTEPMSVANRRMLRQRETEFRDTVTAVNAKINRLNMLVPTLRQQLVHFDAKKEMERVAAEHLEHIAAGNESVSFSPSHRNQTQYSSNTCELTNSDRTTLRDVLRELKALFSS